MPFTLTTRYSIKNSNEEIRQVIKCIQFRKEKVKLSLTVIGLYLKNDFKVPK